MKKNNKKILVICISGLCFFLITACLSTNSLLQIASELTTGTKLSYTNQEAVGALKDALVEGAIATSGVLSKENSYYKNSLYKIYLPEEASPMLNAIEKIPGGSSLIEDVVLRLNRTAEESAEEIIPIFKNAITSMTITDGIKIVTGGDRAATDYLKEKTYSQLVNLYRPKISTVLKQPLVANISADKAWSTLVTKYNTIAIPANKAALLLKQPEPMPMVEVDLASYATKKALDAVFIQLGNEEQKIRANPYEYTSALIQKVFGAVLQGN